MPSFLRISLWDSCMSFLEINTILYLQHRKVYSVTIVHTSHFLVCWPNSQVMILSVNIASRSSQVPMAAIILLCDPYLPCPWLTGPGARHLMQVGPISVFLLETWDWSMAEPVKHSWKLWGSHVPPCGWRNKRKKNKAKAERKAEKLQFWHFRFLVLVHSWRLTVFLCMTCVMHPDVLS